MSLDHWQLILISGLAGLIIGFSKSGIKGVAMMAVALLALGYDAKASTGILLPILIGADIMAVIYYHRHANIHYLKKLIPWMAAGVLVGVWLGAELPEDLFKIGMALIILFSVVFMYWWDKANKQIPTSRGFAPVLGLAAGFATMVGNLAGAFSNIYFLSMRLPKNEFIGTAAWLFFIINLFKLPFHIWVWGTINVASFKISLGIFPFVIVGFFLGIRLVKLIKDANYRKMILLLTAIGALVIFFK